MTYRPRAKPLTERPDFRVAVRANRMTDGSGFTYDVILAELGPNASPPFEFPCASEQDAKDLADRLHSAISFYSMTEIELR